MAAHRLTLRELTDFIKLGASNDVEEFISSQPDAVATLLGVDPDSDAVPCDVRSLQERCAAHLRSHRQELLQARIERADASVRRLGGSARTSGGRSYLDVSEMLGPLLAHPTAKYVRFCWHTGDSTTTRMSKLREVRRWVRFPDLRVYVDGEGLHFRWHGGAGGLTFFSVPVPSHEQHQVLAVPLSASPVQSAQRAEARQPSHSQSSGAWLGDVLAELGLV